MEYVIERIGLFKDSIVYFFPLKGFEIPVFGQYSASVTLKKKKRTDYIITEQ